MSRWSEEFLNHPIHQTIVQISETLTFVQLPTETEAIEEAQRLRKFVSELTRLLKGVDPELVPIPVLDQINGHLKHAHFLPELEANSKSSNVSHLKSANDHVNEILPQILQLKPSAIEPEARELTVQVEGFLEFQTAVDARTKAAESILRKYKGECEAIVLRLEEFKDYLGELEESAQTRLAEWQTDFTGKQTSRAEEFSESQISRANEFEEALGGLRSDAEAKWLASSEEAQAKLSATVTHFEEVGDKLVVNMKKKHSDVLEIHGLVGRDSVAGGYQQSAVEERAAADLWRRVSMGSLTLAVAWLAIKYFSGFAVTSSGSPNWTEIVTASSLTAIILLAAGYASRQSKFHRENEKQMRWFALETKALDPFIASLDVSEQKAIKAELIRRMFGRQQRSGSEKSSSIDEGTLKTIVDRLGETVRDTVGKLIDKG